jgi:hypothetical protein
VVGLVVEADDAASLVFHRLPPAMICGACPVLVGRK